jgi:hypothetical protein
MPAQGMETKVERNASEAKVRWAFMSLGKELIMQKAKGNLTKLKCFYCDNHKHLAKDCPKPPLVSDCISQGKMIFQGGFMAKIGAHKSKASNLLKLKCKMNNELVCCFLDSRVTNSSMTFASREL